MKKNIIILALTAVSTFFIGQTIMLSEDLKKSKENITVVEQKCTDSISDIKEEKKAEDALTAWDMFTLALMKVESGYNPKAESSAGAKGYFQFMPIYVKEVNRIHGTNYKYEEVVKSFKQSYEVFNLMQTAHNKDFRMDRALEIHNGNHKWYHQRVYNELEKIEKYEEMRKMLKEANETNETISIPY